MDKDMPEEIWARPDTYEGVWNTAPDGYTGETKYTRTDRYEALQKLARSMAAALTFYAQKGEDHGAWAEEEAQAYEQFMAAQRLKGER